MNLIFFNGNNLVNDDLSPVSALRLNFDRLPTETTDPVTPTKNVFGVPVPQFVPESIISWLDNTNIDSGSNQSNHSDTQSNGLASEKVTFSNNELSNAITRKVCTFLLENVIPTSIQMVHFCWYFRHLGGQCTDD